MQTAYKGTLVCETQAPSRTARTHAKRLHTGRTKRKFNKEPPTDRTTKPHRIAQAKPGAGCSLLALWVAVCVPGRAAVHMLHACLLCVLQDPCTHAHTNTHMSTRTHACTCAHTPTHANGVHPQSPESAHDLAPSPAGNAHNGPPVNRRMAATTSFTVPSASTHT